MGASGPRGESGRGESRVKSRLFDDSGDFADDGGRTGANGEIRDSAEVGDNGDGGCRTVGDDELAISVCGDLPADEGFALASGKRLRGVVDDSTTSGIAIRGDASAGGAGAACGASARCGTVALRAVFVVVASIDSSSGGTAIRENTSRPRAPAADSVVADEGTFNAFVRTSFHPAVVRFHCSVVRCGGAGGDAGAAATVGLIFQPASLRCFVHDNGAANTGLTDGASATMESFQLAFASPRGFVHDNTREGAAAAVRLQPDVASLRCLVHDSDIVDDDSYVADGAAVPAFSDQPTAALPRCFTQRSVGLAGAAAAVRLQPPPAMSPRCLVHDKGRALDDAGAVAVRLQPAPRFFDHASAVNDTAGGAEAAATTRSFQPTPVPPRTRTRSGGIVDTPTAAAGWAAAGRGATATAMDGGVGSLLVGRGVRSKPASASTRYSVQPPRPRLHCGAISRDGARAVAVVGWSCQPAAASPR